MEKRKTRKILIIIIIGIVLLLLTGIIKLGRICLSRWTAGIVSIMSELNDQAQLSISQGQVSIEIEGNGSNNKKNYIYYDSVEEALANATTMFSDTPYMMRVDEIIKRWESDEYAVIYYRAIKDSKTEGFVLCKFKVQDKGKKQYAVMACTSSEAKVNSWYLNNKPIEDIRIFTEMEGYVTNYSVYDNKKFRYGSSILPEIQTLTIEGVPPTEIISYKVFEKTEYMWYYEDFDFDKPISELDIHMDGHEE